MSFDPTSTSIGDFNVQEAIYEYNPMTPEPNLFFIGWCIDDNFKVKGTEIYMSND